MIAIHETNGQDWRAAYHERISDGIEELRQERARQVKRRLYYGTRTYIVKDLTDQQIEEVARIEAERTCQRAINELREGERVSKLNRGEAA